VRVLCTRWQQFESNTSSFLVRIARLGRLQATQACLSCGSNSPKLVWKGTQVSFSGTLSGATKK
jgi:hypothetical protein